MKLAETLPQRGYNVVYRAGETNHCPGCGRSSWIVGRVSAECANPRCGVALPFPANALPSGRGGYTVRNYHIPENRPRTVGTPTIHRRDYYIPTKHMLD